jgi:hypothetical protein
MKTILNYSSIVLGAFLILSITANTSCKKDKTCKGRVHVVDSVGVAVPTATVVLDAPQGDINYTGTTDGSGDVLFEVTLPAIFDVTATKDGMTGTGVLRLDEPGKEDAETVTLTP